VIRFETGESAERHVAYSFRTAVERMSRRRVARAPGLERITAFSILPRAPGLGLRRRESSLDAARLRAPRPDGMAFT